MKATSKSDDDSTGTVAFGVVPFGPISSAPAGKGRAGSTGSCVVADGCAVDSVRSDAASASQMKIVGTTLASRQRESGSADVAVRPTTAPASLNTGPPDPPKASLTFVSMRRG